MEKQSFYMDSKVLFEIPFELQNLWSSMIAGVENMATFYEHKLWLWFCVCVCFCVHLSDELNWPWSEVLGIFLDEGKGDGLVMEVGYITQTQSPFLTRSCCPPPQQSILVRIFLSQKRRRRWGFGVMLSGPNLRGCPEASRLNIALAAHNPNKLATD
jgi:hypothetical protein